MEKSQDIPRRAESGSIIYTPRQSASVRPTPHWVFHKLMHSICAAHDCEAHNFSRSDPHRVGQRRPAVSTAMNHVEKRRCLCTCNMHDTLWPTANIRPQNPLTPRGNLVADHLLIYVTSTERSIPTIHYTIIEVVVVDALWDWWGVFPASKLHKPLDVAVRVLLVDIAG